MLQRIGLLAVIATAFLAVGCAEKCPPIHEVTGKVTHQGKPYKRLLVYFRPDAATVNTYGSNMAVGETDGEGKLNVMSAAGLGLSTGTYRVTFALFQESGRRGGSPKPNEKPDESGVTVKQVVKPPYDDETSQETTEVRFTVRAGTNSFEFDIP